MTPSSGRCEYLHACAHINIQTPYTHINKIEWMRRNEKNVYKMSTSTQLSLLPESFHHAFSTMDSMPSAL